VLFRSLLAGRLYQSVAADAYYAMAALSAAALAIGIMLARTRDT
jgi:hypothetical protein